MGRRLVERLIEEGPSGGCLCSECRESKTNFSQYSLPELDVVTYTAKETGDWQPILSACDGVVNLAGEPLFDDRWNTSSKKKL